MKPPTYGEYLSRVESEIARRGGPDAILESEDSEPKTPAQVEVEGLATQELAIQLRRNGRPISEICKATQKRYSTVKAILERAGLSTKQENAGSAFTEDQKRAAAARVPAEGPTAVARSLGINHSTIKRWVRKFRAQ